MTARDVILKTLEDERDIGGVNTLTDRIIDDLNKAGFVIVRQPSEVKWR